MNQRLVAVGLVVVIVISISAYFVFFPTKSSFQFQDSTIADNEDYVVGVYNIKNCEVSVSFASDTSLLYSMNIEMYGSVRPTVFYLHEDNYKTLLNYYQDSSLATWSREEVPVKKLDLVLGTGKAYKIYVWGTNLTATVTYSNGALIGQGSYFQFRSDNGSVFVDFNGAEVDDSTLGSTADPVRMDFDLGRQDFDDLQLTYAEIDMDLPYFYYGDLDVIANIIDVSYSGWSRSPIPEVFSYYTDVVQGEGYPPEVYIDVFSVEVVANLGKATSP